MIKEKKGSFTVEAVFVCSFVCLVLILMIFLTLRLYEKTKEYGLECCAAVEAVPLTAEALRMEHAACGIWDMLMEKKGE